MNCRISTGAVTTADAEHHGRHSQQERGLGDARDEHHSDLPEEVRQWRHRRTQEPFQGAVLALDRDLDRQGLEAHEHDPAATMPGRKYWTKSMLDPWPSANTAPSSPPKTAAKSRAG
jgi:hypothetical protein